MQRGPREREARYLQFNSQRPGNLIYIPHLLAHAFLTVDTGSPMILSRCDAGTKSNQQVILQTLDEHTFGVRRGKWRKSLCKKKVYQFYASGCFLLQQAPRKIRVGYKKTGIFVNSTLISNYCQYTSKKRFPVRLNVSASPHTVIWTPLFA